MTEEINEGVRLLVERLKTNPEDIANHSRWYGLANNAFTANYLTERERGMVESAYREAARHNFTAEVLRALTGVDVESERMTTIKAEGRYTIGTGRSGTYGAAISPSSSLNTMIEQKLQAMKDEFTQPSPFGAVPKEK